MWLSDIEVKQAVEQAARAFPGFTDWDCVNEADDEHDGFTLWGEYVIEPDSHHPRRFFITFARYKDSWRGYLTIGQYSYYWSSSTSGDAYLVDTEKCASLEDAITALKGEITHLFQHIVPT